MQDLLERARIRWAVRDEGGQGMVEYALLITFVALVVIAALMLLGPKVAEIFNTAGNSL